MESKEEQMLELFFNSPTKQWRFKDILKTAKITRSKADKWLKLFCHSNTFAKISSVHSLVFLLAWRR